MAKVVMILCALIGLALARPEKSGPYPAKGWKPQGARLELPRNDYGPPREQSNGNSAVDVEITTLANEYLPPTTVQSESNEDTLRVQGLPAVDAVSQFRNFQQRQRTENVQARQPTARIQMAPAPAFGGQPFLLTSIFAPQFAPVSEQLQERKFNQQQQQEVSEFSNPKNDAQQLPAQAYGPPKTNNDVPEVKRDEPQVPQNEEQPQSERDDDYDDDREASSIAVSNAVSDMNLLQVTLQGQVGQYYILLPDSSLQKVRFATKQTDEDRQINGFSAQLRYSPVESIKDPVYGYDEQGKLVRLFK